MVPVVDLFAGPGGLAEGFSACRRPDGRRRYRIALSIEKDPVAHRTLLLRAFLRRFAKGFPPEYYDYLNGVAPEEPDWAKLYPKRWAAACDETKCLELGTSEASAFLRDRITQIRSEHGERTVLLGGPPCQAYSVIGRSRNAGNAEYNADEDDRQSLYEQYVHVLWQLRPAVAVMENVKGMLSARLNGERLFPKVMRHLRDAGGLDGYRLFALASRSAVESRNVGLKPEDFLVHAEQHGVPQTRHRVFVICVRRDVAEELGEEHLPRLEPEGESVPLDDIIGAMPRLRSRLSQDDDPGSWQDAVRAAHDLVIANQPPMSNDQEFRFGRALARALATANGTAPPSRDARGNTRLPAGCPRDLRDWIFDERLRTTRTASRAGRGRRSRRAVTPTSRLRRRSTSPGAASASSLSGQALHSVDDMLGQGAGHRLVRPPGPRAEAYGAASRYQRANAMVPAMTPLKNIAFAAHDAGRVMSRPSVTAAP